MSKTAQINNITDVTRSRDDENDQTKQHTEIQEKLLLNYYPTTTTVTTACILNSYLLAKSALHLYKKIFAYSAAHFLNTLPHHLKHYFAH